MRSRPILSFAVLFLFLSPLSRSSPLSVPFQISNAGLIEVICQIQSMPGKILFCIIDTGAQNSMAAVSSVSRKSMHAVPVISYLTPAGKQTAYLTKQTILLGGLPIPATVEVTPMISTLDTDVLIGEDVLSQFQGLSIDYVHHVLTFDTK